MVNDADWKDFIDTLIAEAGGEGPEGLAAVAYAIKNRAARRGQSVGEVVRAPHQFDGYANPGSGAKASQMDPRVRAAAERIAQQVMAGEIADPTGGADHFYSGDNTPGWARRLAHTSTIGGHKFHTSGAASRGTPEAPGFLALLPREQAEAEGAALGLLPDPSGAGDAAPITWNLGPRRPERPGAEIEALVRNTVGDLRIPGAEVVGTSGKGDYGSPFRHPLGNALDFHVALEGSETTPDSDQQLYLDIAQNLAADGADGLGHYPWGMHADVSGHANAWGPSKGSETLDPRFATAIAAGRRGDRVMPYTGPIPELRPGSTHGIERERDTSLAPVPHGVERERDLSAEPLTPMLPQERNPATTQAQRPVSVKAGAPAPRLPAPTNVRTVPIRAPRPAAPAAPAAPSGGGSMVAGGSGLGGILSGLAKAIASGAQASAQAQAQADADWQARFERTLGPGTLALAQQMPGEVARGPEAPQTTRVAPAESVVPATAEEILAAIFGQPIQNEIETSRTPLGRTIG